ncbi:MAG: hypothetical protein ACTSPQ_11020 [Candidatus Helarchaeota archaeon]
MKIKIYEHSNIHLNKIKLLIAPFFTERNPNIILEVIPSITPILTHKIIAILEITINNSNCFLMRNNDLKAISNKIYKIFKDKDLELLPKNYQKFLKLKFNFEITHKKFKRFMKKDIKEFNRKISLSLYKNLRWI